MKKDNMTEHDQLAARRAKLTPAQQKLLELRLRGARSSGRPAAGDIPRRPPGADAPVSFAQQSLWFLDRLQPQSALYNIANAIHIRGPLDAAALERCLNEIVRRHEILRTAFRAVGDVPVQVVMPTLTVPLVRTDLRAPATTDPEVAARRILDQEACQPFRLDTPPLLRARLIQFGTEDHVLALTMHHIIFDGWSYGLMLDELAALYPAFVAGQPSPLAEVALQYGDYASWQQNWLAGDGARHFDFWRKQLAAAPELLDLPTDRPRPVAQSYAGAVHTVTLTRAEHQALKAFSAREGVTMFMTLLAAYKVLLYRYTGQEDLIVGTPAANRSRVELEGVMGFVVNMLVLRTRVEGRLPFREFLRRVSDTSANALDHQDMPFDKLVQELCPTRTPSYNPLFQVAFVHQKAPGEEVRIGGLTLSSFPLMTQTAKFDVTLFAEEEADGLRLTFEYATDLFDAATVARMAGHYRQLLTAVLAEPAGLISQLPMLTENEQKQLLEVWNRNDVNFPPARSLHQWFEAQVELTPEAVALVYENSRLTYRELNARANQLAHHLRRQGAGPDQLVGLCVERSLDLLVAILGILKSGAAYLPLDLTYPKDRVAYILADANAPLLVTQSKLAEGLSGHQARIIRLDADAAAIAMESTANPPPNVSAENLAYVIYTSGSTGRPKGMLITHHNVVRLMQATEPWYHFNGQDVWTMFHSCAFDFSVWEIWGALLYGGRLVVVPYLTSRSPEAFYQLLCDQQVTVLNQTPAAFRQLMQAEEEAGLNPKLALRYVIFGGEMLELKSLKPWFDRHGDQRPQLVNMYGITETTVHVTYRPIRATDLAGGSVVGVPIPDLQVHLLDANRQLVPVGVPGEMYVGGAGLGRGYYNRPELTAEKFIPDPFQRQPGARLYRSGDQARRLPNGDLEYLGRIDFQVKIRGFRVELGEIESVVNESPGVRESAVILREDVPGDKRLVAYVVTTGEWNVAELRQRAAVRLPDYMVPSAFVRLDQLPLTNNGKVDRRALPVPEGGAAPAGEDYAAPTTPVQEKLAAIWAELLRVDRLGVQDNFFERGGHSLLGTRLMARVRREFELEVPLRVLFERPTVASMAEAIVQLQLQQNTPEDIDRLLAEIEGLSDTESTSRLEPPSAGAPPA